ncbi:MAG: hypothetical protein V3T72_03325, partial [Thermoanaerobaculia bacterium]
SDETIGWLILPGEAVGPIRLGITKQELESRVGIPERTSLGAWEYLSDGYAVLMDASSSTVSAVLAGGGTEQVRLDERFHGRTAAGLGMGSTKPEILDALGEPSVERAQDDSLHLEYRRLGVEFMLVEERVRWLAVRTAIEDPNR